jgi:hypothetical protein
MAPSWMRDVRAATALSSVYASNIGSVGGPTLAIWW